MNNTFSLVAPTVDFVKVPSEAVELLIGCGNSREKRLDANRSNIWKNVYTLDIDPSCNPDVVWNLDDLPLPFEDETFEEIHAYEVLEHCGKQGDWRFFFAQFAEFWRILKPGGMFYATTPCWDAVWAWGDPGHTRVFTPGTLNFLSQDAYNRDVGKTMMTDYRGVWPHDFQIAGAQETNGQFCFVLRKPDPATDEAPAA
jgi:SAM-dependent methyltransferase